VVETEVGKAAAAAAYHVRRVYGLPASRAWEVRPGSNFPCTGADEAGLPGRAHDHLRSAWATSTRSHS